MALQETASSASMLRFLARFFGLWLLAGALVALVVDGAKSIAASEIIMTPLGELWYSVRPESLDALKSAVETHLHPVLWDPVILWVLLAPTFVVAAVVGTLLLIAGQKRRAPLPELDMR